MAVYTMIINSILLLTAADLSRAAQPSAPAPQRAPIRELSFGQLSFLHTTDTHGWHAGHLQEPSYSADWGDYVSLAHHMRAKADKDGVDLLLVDTGDRIEGNGLYDGSDPKGEYTFDIVKEQDIDIICSGNHELYKANSSINEFYKTVTNFKGNYLASNLDIRLNESADFQSLAPRYRKFKTKNQGIEILAFGFMFNFQGGASNTRITPVQDAIKEKWFQDAIREKVDIFVVTGHAAIRSQEFEMIFKAIREVQWDVPIQFFGGHTHVRDYLKFDSKAYALESGRYMETIGFASVDGLKSASRRPSVTKKGPTFKRRYIDSNLFSYQYHAGLNETTFPTEHGRNVSVQIAAARKKLNLDDTHGCAPRDLWLNRVPANNTNSIFKWLRDEVTPDQFTDPDKDAQPKLVITNTGALRFDIFKGPFTRDTTFLVAPFTSGYRVIKNVESSIAFQLIKVLNGEGPLLRELDPSLDPYLLVPPASSLNPAVDAEASILAHAGQPEQHALKEKPLSPGYTTKDDAGDDGDDTLHTAIPYFRVPSCIQSAVNFPPDDEVVKEVDVVYNEFLESWIIIALKFLGADVGREDTSDYLGGRSLTDIINDWVEDNWPCDEKDEL